MTDVHRGPMHDHDHEHQAGLWARLAAALHMPGHRHSHSHADRAPYSSSRDNTLAIRTVWLALLALGVTTVLQIVIYAASGSVALLADTVHNLGDTLNSVPLLVAFLLTRRQANRRYTYGYGRAEDIAGLLIVASIAFSAAYILWEPIQKLIHPRSLDNLGWVAAAAVIGFLGNEAVALLQVRVGRRIGSEAMVADGLHARVDGLTSLAVLVAVGGTALGYPVVDPVVGIVIGLTIVLIAREAAVAMWYRLMDAVDPEMVERAEKTILQHPAVHAIRRLRMRWSGHQLYAEVVLAAEVTQAAEGEAMADHIRHHLYHELPNLADAIVAVVPADSGERGIRPETAHHYAPS
jgi:cation diffusion facilitator family transporter